VAVVFIPSLLRPLADGQRELRVPGATLRDVIDELDRQYPGFRERLIEDGAVRGNLQFAIDREVARDLNAAVGDDTEVHILPAISGGSLSF
jgi:molybdopterin synthase sulfur carrier subunit